MAVEWLSRAEADRAGTREETVLLEQTPDHYPEFGTFIRGRLEETGGNLYFRGPSGLVYRVGQIEDNPEGLRGIEICVRVEEESQTVAPEADLVDLDLWAFLEWLVPEVGQPWSLDGLRRTGAIYRIPGAPDRA